MNHPRRGKQRHAAQGRGLILVRLFSLIRILAVNRRATPQAIASQLCVHVKTVYRDLDVLEAAGLPLLRIPNPDAGSRGIYVRVDRLALEQFLR